MRRKATKPPKACDRPGCNRPVGVLLKGHGRRKEVCPSKGCIAWGYQQILGERESTMPSAEDILLAPVVAVRKKRRWSNR